MTKIAIQGHFEFWLVAVQFNNARDQFDICQCRIQRCLRDAGSTRLGAQCLHPVCKIIRIGRRHAGTHQQGQQTHIHCTTGRQDSGTISLKRTMQSCTRVQTVHAGVQIAMIHSSLFLHDVVFSVQLNHYDWP